MDAEALIDFLARRGKFIESDEGFQTRADKICNPVDSRRRALPGARRIPRLCYIRPLFPLLFEGVAWALYGHFFRCRHAVSDHGSLGNLPVFLSILRHVDPKRRRKVMIRELLFSLGIMMGFLFAGQQILSFLNLRQEAVSIAGGIILFLIAIKMIFPDPRRRDRAGGGEGALPGAHGHPHDSGPSILASLLLLANQEPTRMVDWSLALLMAWGASAVILMFYELFNKLLGERGLTAVERLMGMLLVMIRCRCCWTACTTIWR